jgi:hypothetical protein
MEDRIKQTEAFAQMLCGELICSSIVDGRVAASRWAWPLAPGQGSFPLT